MELRIGTIVIERFRAFRELRIEGLGRVNLITGRNNTGKSSVLEAIRILASDASPVIISNILRYREEDIGEPEEQGRPIDIEGLFQVSTLFNGFPQLSEDPEPIVISTNGGQRPMKLTLEIGWVSEQTRRGRRQKTCSHDKKRTFSESRKAVPALIVGTGNATRVLPLDYFRRASLPLPAVPVRTRRRTANGMHLRQPLWRRENSDAWSVVGQDRAVGS